MQINKKKLLAFIFLITACVVGFVVVYRYFDSVPVSFTAINLEKISIKTSTGAVLHESANPSNFSVRVPKQTTIEVEFNGKEGYETNTKNERIGNKPKTISIKPYYSESRLAKLAANEEMTLIAVLKKESILEILLLLSCISLL